MIHKKISASILLGIALVFVGTLSLSGSQVSAADNSDKYCKGRFPNSDQTSVDQKNACEVGYKAGFTGKDIGECDLYNRGDIKDRLKSSCRNGHGTGVTDKKNESANDGRTGAEALPNPTPKGTACAAFSGGSISAKSKKKSCEEAYDKAIVSRAKKDGKKAGEDPDSAASPCPSLGYGGAKVKQACNDAYEAAQKKLGSKGKNDCGGVDTYFKFDCGTSKTESGGSNNPLYHLALEIVGWFTAIVSVAIIGGVVYGGFLYMSANDNANQTKQGITVIINAVVALLLLLMTFTIINFIVPGGLFK